MSHVHRLIQNSVPAHEPREIRLNRLGPVDRKDADVEMILLREDPSISARRSPEIEQNTIPNPLGLVWGNRYQRLDGWRIRHQITAKYGLPHLTEHSVRTNHVPGFNDSTSRGDSHPVAGLLQPHKRCLTLK